MPRLPRRLLLSEINHIMLRGIDHMDIFLDDNDYLRFIETIQRFCKDYESIIHAYCLMSNHVHLLIQVSPELVPFLFKRIEISYAKYFNGSHDHVGHLFQNRYQSQPITTDAHYLNALRYILRNPQTAGICNNVIQRAK